MANIITVKLSKEDKRDLKKSNQALNDLIRRAKAKGAFIECSYKNMHQSVVVLLGNNPSE